MLGVGRARAPTPVALVVLGTMAYPTPVAVLSIGMGQEARSLTRACDVRWSLGEWGGEARLAREHGEAMPGWQGSMGRGGKAVGMGRRCQAGKGAWGGAS